MRNHDNEDRSWYNRSMSDSRSEGASNALFGMLAFAFFLALAPYGGLDRDEGWLVEQSWRLLNGEVPHRDSVNIYPAGRYVLVAALMKLTGETVWAARLAGALLEAITAMMVLVVGRRMMPLSLALCAAGTTALLPGAWHKAWYGLVPLVIFWCWQRWLEGQDRRWAWVTGLVAGLGFWFRQDTALFSLVAIGVVVGARARDERQELSALWTMWGTAGAVILAGLAAYSVVVSPVQLLSELFVRAASAGMPDVPSASRSLQVEGRHGVADVGVAVLCGVITVWSLGAGARAAWRGWTQDRQTASQVLWLVVVGLLMSNQILRANVVTRFLQVSPPLFLLWWASGPAESAKVVRAMSFCALVAVPLTLLAGLLPRHDGTAAVAPKFSGSVARWMAPYEPYTVDGRELYVVPSDRDVFMPVALWLRHAEEKVLLVPGPSALYAVAGRRNPSRYVRWTPDDPSHREHVLALAAQDAVDLVVVQRSFLKKEGEAWGPLLERCCVEDATVGQHTVYRVRR